MDPLDEELVLALEAINNYGQILRSDVGSFQTTENIAHLRTFMRIEDSLLEFAQHMVTENAKDLEALTQLAPAGTD
jgi:hypothetical protein